jgi:hypothetical protein
MKVFLLTIFVNIVIFTTGCGHSTNENNVTVNPIQNSQKRVYGKSLNIDIEVKNFDNATLYIPVNAKVDEKLPVVLLAPGWSSVNHSDYKTLLTFISSQGYAVIYVPSPKEKDASVTISGFLTVLNDETVSNFFDKSKLGVIGHSSGGGLTFKIMAYFSKHGYGSLGRFIFAMDPWFAFGMGEEEFKNFPQNTQFIIQQYGNSGGTDPRIALTIFDKLSILGDENMDYQYYKDLNHGYPFANSYKKLQVILKPLDAMMDYTFYKKQEAYKIALELGSDEPYTNLQPIKSIENYEWRCNDNYHNLKGLDYCAIAP